MQCPVLPMSRAGLFHMFHCLIDEKTGRHPEDAGLYQYQLESCGNA